MTELEAAGEARETAGLTRWLVLGVAFLCFLLSFVDRLVWANVAVSVGGTLGLPAAALGVFATAFYIGYVVCNALGGLASDRLGGRATLGVSMLALGAATALFGSATTVAFGLAAQGAMGFAAGADYAACIKLVVAWFDRRTRGRAMGLLLVASSLGVTVTNALVPTLVNAFGWQGVYRTLGGLTVAAGLLALAVVRDGPSGATRAAVPWKSLHALMRSRNMIALAIAGFAGFWGTWGFAFWANALMIKGHGFSAVEAGTVVSLVGVAAIVGKPLIGLLSDLTGGRPKWLTIATFVLFAIMLLVFGALTDRRAFALAAPLLGLGAFLYSPLMAALVAANSGVALAGSAAGLLAGLWQIGSVIVPIVVGLVFDRTGSFEAAFATLAIGPAVAAVALLAVRDRPGT